MNSLNEHSPQGELVRSERINPNHFDFMLRLMNDPEVSRMEGKEYIVHDAKTQEEWFKANCNSTDKDYWIFLDKVSGQPVGYFSFKLVDKISKVGRVGIKVSPDFHGFGFGKDILVASMNYYFRNRGTLKLLSHIIEYNDVSLSLFVKSQKWKIDTNKRGSVFINGKDYRLIYIYLTDKDYFYLNC
jgi:RimJ/RimL family protein N-acetyltransferase